MSTPFKLYFEKNSDHSIVSQEFESDSSANNTVHSTVFYNTDTSSLKFSDLFNGINISSSSSDNTISIGDTVTFEWNNTDGQKKTVAFKINDSFNIVLEGTSTVETKNDLYKLLGDNLDAYFPSTFNTLNTSDDGVNNNELTLDNVFCLLSMRHHKDYSTVGDDSKSSVYYNVYNSFSTYKSFVQTNSPTTIGAALTDYYTNNTDGFGFIIKYFLTQSDSSTFSSIDIDLYVNTTFSYDSDTNNNVTKLIKFTKHA
jgi:hypothetical protein